MSRQPAADVLVIGSGASGAAVSWRLAGLGASVICLEQGDWVDRERLPKNHLDWEVRGRRFWAANPNVRRWPADYPVGSEGENPVDIYMYNAVGGSTIGFAGNYWRMAPSDFKVRTLDGAGVDWPLTYEAYYGHPRVLAALEKETGWSSTSPTRGSAMKPFDASRLERVRNLPARWRKA